MNILGLDLSLTATGWCSADGGGVIDQHASLRGPERLVQIAHSVQALVPPEPALVVIEGYSYASGNQTHQVGELGGVVRSRLWCSEMRYVDVPPTTLKKFATGKGNAGKDQMIATAARLGCPFDDNNAVDAWWLYQMGLYMFGPTDMPVTKYRDEAVHTVDWPEL